MSIIIKTVTDAVIFINKLPRKKRFAVVQTLKAITDKLLLASHCKKGCEKCSFLIHLSKPFHHPFFGCENKYFVTDELHRLKESTKIHDKHLRLWEKRKL